MTPDERVLVTGATGLIGRHVVSALVEQGAEVHAAGCSRVPRSNNGDGVRWHAANLLDERERAQLLQAARPQTMVHCAWVTEQGAYWTSPKNLDWVAATLSLAKEATEFGLTRFIGVGTCAEYAWGGTELLSEATTPLRPATLYGIAKDATRRVLESYAAASGLSFAWARLAMLYGAGEHHDRFVASLARAFVRGEPARMASGKAIRDIMDARDVGAAIAAVAMSPLTGAVNIGSGEPVSLRHVGEMLARVAGRPDLLRVSAFADRANEPERLVMDVARLVHETGFRPKIELERGLGDALVAWRGSLTTPPFRVHGGKP